jgi:hypothetical protein
MKITYILWHRWAVACMASIGLAGCAGNSSSNSGTSSPGPPPPKTSGPIVQIGLVGGQASDGGWSLSDAQPELYIPSGADVKIDGVSTAVAGLAMDGGEVIRIAGTAGTDKNSNPIITATHIRITHMLDGPVDAVDTDHGTMTVLGQTVIGTADFKVGDRASVSGHPSAAGQIVPTRIAASTRAGDFLTSGIISSTDAANKQFQLNGIVVDYSTAELPNLPTGAPSEGERVLVWSTRLPGSNTLMASSVADDSGLQAEAGASVSMHGIVTSVQSGSGFTLDGFAATTALGGHSIPVANADVTVDGTITSGDTTALSNLEYTVPSPDPRGFVQGPIDSIDATFGTLVILGFKIQPNITTHVVDIEGTTIPLSALKIGDVVLAGGTDPTGGMMFANSLAQFSASTSSMIRGSALEVTMAQPIVYLYGRTITTDTNTVYYYMNPSTTPLDPSIFWSKSNLWRGDRHCPGSVALTFVPQTDGSLLGTTIVVEPPNEHCIESWGG